MSEPLVIVSNTPKRGRPPLSDEEKEKRKQNKKKIGRPVGSKKPEHLKKPRVDKRPRKEGGRANNGKAPGFSGTQYTLHFKDDDEDQVFYTLKDIAQHYGVSSHFIRNLKAHDWSVANFTRIYNREAAEKFENLESVDEMNVSQKYWNEVQRDMRNN